MPTYNIVLPDAQTAIIAGTRPFSRRQTGGTAGGVEIKDAGDNAANPLMNGEGCEKVFADSNAGLAIVDAVIYAANNVSVNTVAPAITGTAQVGQVLATTGGTFTGTPAPTKTYQWYANGVAINGATAANYTPVVGDIGKTITVTVTGTNASGVAAATSAATAAVIAA